MNARCNGLYAGQSQEEVTSHSAEVLATAWANCPPYQKDRIFSANYQMPGVKKPGVLTTPGFLC
jgi:hypothetical protein